MNANTLSIRHNAGARTLGALILMGTYALAAVPQAQAQQPYLQLATASNIVSNWTDLSKKDSNHNSIYFVTSNWNPPGKPGVYNNHPIGVWFDPYHKDWAIFNQDGSPIPDGASFNVWVLK